MHHEERRHLRLLLIAGLGLSVPTAQTQAPAGPAVVKMDPSLDAIIASDAKLEILKEEYFAFTEGPVWFPEAGGGYLLFSDLPANKIYKWDPKGGLSVFLDPSGFTGKEFPDTGAFSNGRFYVHLIGSNALARDAEGRLVFCTHGDRALCRLEKDGKTRTVLADKFEGKRLSGPNDLTIKKDGTIYFSDRGSQLRGGMKSPERELPFNAIFRLKDGKVDVMEKDDPGVNGVALSPDEKFLFAISTGQIFKYDVAADGTLTNRQPFVDMRNDKAPGGPDGMKVDKKGNVFSVGPGGVWIISPAGKLLGKVNLPNPAANVAFGDADYRGLYITARTSLMHIRLAAPAL